VDSVLLNSLKLSFKKSLKFTPIQKYILNGDGCKAPDKLAALELEYNRTQKKKEITQGALEFCTETLQGT
jgi:hypothetical protein